MAAHTADYWVTGIRMDPITVDDVLRRGRERLPLVRRHGDDPEAFLGALKACFEGDSRRFCRNWLWSSLFRTRPGSMSTASLDLHRDPYDFTLMTSALVYGNPRKDRRFREALDRLECDGPIFRDDCWTGFGPDLMKRFTGTSKATADMFCSVLGIVFARAMKVQRIRKIRVSVTDFAEVCLDAEKEMLAADEDGILEVLPSELFAIHLPDDVRAEFLDAAEIRTAFNGFLIPKISRPAETKPGFFDDLDKESKTLYGVVRLLKAADDAVSRHMLDDPQVAEDPDFFDRAARRDVTHALERLNAGIDMLSSGSLRESRCAYDSLCQKAEYLRSILSRADRTASAGSF